MNRILSGVIGVGIWPPVGILTACIGYRIGTAAAIELWKRREYLRIDFVAKYLWKRTNDTTSAATPEISDWEKLKRGETWNGFRLWRLHKNESMEDENDDWRVTSREIVPPPWPKFDDDEKLFEIRLNENEPLTVLGAVDHRRPKKSPDDGMLVLRRYSIVDPSVYEDIARIVYERHDQDNHRGWSCAGHEQLDDFTVAVRFMHLGNAADRIILIDTPNRSYRQFEIPPSGKLVQNSASGNIVHLRMFLDEDNRDYFSVLYADVRGNPSKFVNIDYEIERSQDPTFTTVRRLGMRCFAFDEEADVDDSHWLCQQINVVRFPGVFFVFSPYPSGRPDMAFVFDHRGQCRKISELGEWLSRNTTNSFGRHIFQASSQFIHKLAYPTAQDQIPSYLVFYYGDLLGIVKCEDIVQLHLRPPSMERQSVEVIRRSIPKCDFPSVIRKETGVDIFDGILEDKKKKSVLMIRLDLIDDNEAMIGLAGIVGEGL